MTLNILKENIKTWKVPSSLYSINEGLKPNAYVLVENYGNWEFFYLDEKGERKDYNFWKDSNEAYEYLWKKLYKEIQYPPSTPPQGVYGKK